MTDAGSPAWIVNSWTAQRLVDSAGNLFPIQTNTAGVIYIGPASNKTVNTTGSAAYQVVQQKGSGNATLPQFRTVTSNTLIADTTTAGVGSATSGAGSTAGFTPHTHVNWVAGMFAGMFFIDAAGIWWEITQNSTTVLTLTLAQGTPATAGLPVGTNAAGGKLWSIVTPLAAGSVELAFFSSTAAAPTVGTLTAAAQIFSGSAATVAPAAPVSAATPTIASATAASSGTPATFTVTAASWTTNQFAGYYVVDNAQNLFLIVSNTNATNSVATVVGVGHDSVAFITPATGAAIIYNTKPSVAAPAGTNATSNVTGTLVAGASSQAATYPASGEFGVVTLQLA
jgi:hypothetical protein